MLVSKKYYYLASYYLQRSILPVHNKGIISKKNKFIYFEIPKVGCTSIKQWLASHCWENLKIKDVHKEKLPTVFNVEKNDYEGYLKFAFVRNPWDRAVSCFSQKSIWGPWLNRNKRFKTISCFDEFVSIISEIPDEEADEHYKSQYTFVCDSKDNIVVDFVGKLESLEVDFDIVCEHLGLAKKKLPLSNESVRKKDYRIYYCDETRKIIEKRYAKDIELFGYRF